MATSKGLQLKIVSIGEITIDHYPELNLSFVGGISLNFAIHAKRCGATASTPSREQAVSLVSRIGSDDNGRFVLNKLSQEKINASHVVILDGKTATCTILVRDAGERIFPEGGYCPNVLTSLQLTQAELRFIQQHDILVARYDHSQPDPFFDQVMVDLNFNGKRVADFGDWADFDGNVAVMLTYLDKLDLAFVSGNQEAIETLRPISYQIDTVIVVTLGAAGSVAVVNGRVYSQPAVLVSNPLDTTGCGDAFQAAFTVTYFQTGNIAQALTQGATLAAKIIQQYGAL